MKKVISVLLCLTLVFSLCIFASAEDAKPNYVVIGDSIAHGTGLSNPREAVYGKIVADTNGYAYENYAIPGHTTQQLLKRMTNDAVKEAITNADIISISIGGNNVLLGNIMGMLYDGIVKDEYGKIEEVADDIYNDIGLIVDYIRQLNSDAAILLQTIYNPQTGYVGDVYAHGTVMINAKIKQFADENPENIYVVDVAAALTDSENDFAEDGIHPSAIGNEKIARAVLQTLCENGLGTETEPNIQTKGKDLHGTFLMSASMSLIGQILHVIAVVRNFFVSLFK